MWAMLKKFINSTVGNKNSKPLDEIIETELYNNYYEIVSNTLGTSETCLVVPMGVETITHRDYAEKASSTTSIILPITTIYLDYNAFKDFTAIRKIVLPKNVNFIGESSFEGCSNMEYADIRSNGITTIDLAFKSCPKLKTVIIRSKNPYFKYSDKSIFAACNALQDIYVGWSKGEFEGAPWGAPPIAAIHYNLEGL